MQNTLIDNSTQFRLVDFLNKLIKDEQCTEICIATGYWDLKGTKLVYDALAPFFERGGRLRLLIGEEPTIRTNQLQAEHPKLEKFPDFYIQYDVNKLTEEYLPVAQLLVDRTTFNESMDSSDSQIQIRVYGQKGEDKKFLHAKCYIFKGEAGSDFAVGIIGSSNFTQRGLEDNAELNYLEPDPTRVDFTSAISTRKSHVQWFEQMWNDESCEDWTGKFIQEILMKAPIAKSITPKPEPEQDTEGLPITPYEAYIRLLNDKFGILADVDAKTVLKSYLPQEINMYEYQLDAAALCYQIMHQHGGFMLGDVVGLGKTIVGILLIKFYLDYAEKEGRDKKVLIIVPPAIKSSWMSTIATFDKDREDKIQPFIDFITTGSIDKALEDDEDEGVGEFEGELKHEMYGLIMIDESHNFRNNGTQMYESLDELISTIGAQRGHYPYIGLLSATPQNNSPLDLRNQIYLFQRTPRESTINVEGHNLEFFFNDAQKRYDKIIHQRPTGETEKQTNRAALRFLMKEIHNKVLADILVRRTRADIRDGYKENIHFPEVVGPVTLDYQLGYKLAKLFDDTMDMIAPSEEKKQLMAGDEYIHYVRYAGTMYLASEELKKPYKGRNMNPEKSSEALARIMQIMLVKRLESSFSAFKQSLRNLQRYTDNMITMWEKDAIFICPQIDVNAELYLQKKQQKYGEQYTIEDCFEDIRKKIERLNEKHRNEKGQNAEYHRADFDPSYVELLRQDKALIDELVERWSLEQRDPKLLEFKKKLNDVLFDPQKNVPQKLVIFSEAIDTVKELAVIAEKQGHSPLLITAANRDEREDDIRANFDANYKGVWRNDYDIIITTEVLAEGVNLHRANTILNYDTPWNSTRLIQRIGRVNRIGSTSKNVYVYNFYPSDEGDSEINLVQRAFTKLQSFHSLFGEDSKVFSEYEELEKIDYKKLVDDTLSEYTPYILELQEYKKHHAARLEYIKNLEEPAIIAMHGGTPVVACVVKAERNSIGQYIIIDEEGRSKIVSALEVFEIARCLPSTLAVDFIDYEIAEKEAIRTYNLHRSKLFKASGSSQIFDQARQVIRDWLKQTGLAKESKQLLSIASRLVGNHNRTVAKRIVQLADQMADQSQLFGTITPDELIQRELQSIAQQQTEREGEPYIYSATQIN